MSDSRPSYPTNNVKSSLVDVSDLNAISSLAGKKRPCIDLVVLEKQPRNPSEEDQQAKNSDTTRTSVADLSQSSIGKFMWN